MSRPPAVQTGETRLGLRANLAQFSLLVGVNALVYIAAFGLTKAATNLLAGTLADLAGLQAAVWVVAALTAASGLVVAVRMYETHRPAGRP